jgi:hypothetical protein
MRTLIPIVGSDVSPRIQSLVRQAVGFAVLLARNVADCKRFKPADHFEGALVEKLKVLAFDFVRAENLANQQLRVASHAHAPLLVLKSKLERGQESLVLGEIVSPPAQIFRERGDTLTIRRGDDHSGSGRAWVATRSAVDPGNPFTRRDVIRAQRSGDSTCNSRLAPMGSGFALLSVQGFVKVLEG